MPRCDQPFRPARYRRGRPWPGSNARTKHDLPGFPIDHTGPAGCDTDQPGSELPDEVVSLPTGLIQAGVAGVIAAQWAIRSEAASLLMARFYQLWRTQGMAPPTALRMAQRWLRDTTNRTKVLDLTAGLGSAPTDPDRRSLIRALRLRDPDDRPYLAAADWAGLSYHGV
ncbi:MAG TPA: CHAT domain-containing protein [Jiangellaceae bacterium]|nr:CHAT domain-containing protein [Jiangellaceae bacterium]